MPPADTLDKVSSSFREQFMRDEALETRRSSFDYTSSHYSQLDKASLLASTEAELPYPPDPDQMYSVDPDPGIRAMNAPQTEKLYFINGMQMEPNEIYFAAKELANVFGREVVIIPNAKEETFLKGLANGFIAATNSGRDIKVENTPVELGIDLLFTEFDTEGAKINLFCYSQGNLILKRVNEVFEARINDAIAEQSPEAQQKLTEHLSEFYEKRMEVWRIGSPYNGAPAGVKSINMQHTADPVAALGHIFTNIDRAKSFFSGKEMSVAETVIANPRGTFRIMPQHSMRDDREKGNYLDDIPLFAVRRNDHLSPEEQAKMLYKSIDAGQLSQDTYDKIVHEYFYPRDEVHGVIDQIFGRMSDREKQQFATALLELAPEGRIKKNTFSTATMNTLNQISVNGMPSRAERATFRAGNHLRPGTGNK